jgi:phosphopantothenoylcysteine synthetase/decarboxylase
MKILVTSGGTKVPIDSVRSITNMSSGRFGSWIAKYALREHEVTYLCAKDAITPFKFSYDLNVGNLEWAIRESSSEYARHIDFCREARDRYREVSFKTYDEYARKLEYLIKQEAPDAIILVAAVSDYICDSSEGKIRSKEDLSINLRQAEKLISKVRGWHPNPDKTFLVGFKLLVGVSDEQLIEEARASLEKNNCNMVVANDLESILNGTHSIIIVEPDQVNTIRVLPNKLLIGLRLLAVPKKRIIS